MNDNILQVFDFNFNNEELQENFNDFFYSNDLLSLFTYEHLATSIKVNYVDALSVVNNGSYAKSLLKFGEVMKIAMDNKMYDDALFKVLFNPTTFQRFMNLVKKITAYYSEVLEQYRHNYWNIVFYSKNIF